MKKIFFITVIIAIIAISVLLFWQVTNSPRYSLKKLDNAIKEHDVNAFNKYVDLDATIDEIIVQTWKHYTAGEATGSRWNEIRSDIGNTLLSVVKPNIKEMIKKEVNAYIVTGEWSGDRTDNGSGISSMIIKIIREKIDPGQWDQQSVNYTEVEGKIAYVGLTYFDKSRDTNFLLEVKMRDMNGYWQIIEISNIAQILNMYQNN
jgi:hypothetical protein